MNGNALIYLEATRSPPEPAALFHLSRAGWILTAADPTRREA